MDDDLRLYLRSIEEKLDAVVQKIADVESEITGPAFQPKPVDSYGFSMRLKFLLDKLETINTAAGQTSLAAWIIAVATVVSVVHHW